MVCNSCSTLFIIEANFILAFYVAQVRLVFQAIPRSQAEVTFKIFQEPLAYVQYFDFTSQRDSNGLLLEEPDVDMYKLERSWLAGQPRGGIIRLTDIARPIEIIPVFGEVRLNSIKFECCI